MDAWAGSRRRFFAAIAAVLVVAVLVARQLTKASEPSPQQPAPLLPAEAAGAGKGRLIVHVVGAVHRPGLYRLKGGARIADAVRRAGGATRKADLEAINLAAPVEDGLQVVVPRRLPPAAGGAPAASGESPAVQGPVHLNTATLEQLDALPGIGPVTAQKILDWREKHGAFTSIEDLDAIPGIGPARLEQLRDVAAP